MRLQYVVSCLAALVFAALVPAAVAAALGGSIELAPIAFGIALGHAFLLGAPFAIFWPTRWINAISCTIIGFLVGAAPGAIFAWPLNVGAGTSGSVDGVATIVNGVPTLAGWFNYIEFLGFLGCFGAVGGFTFWLVMKVSGVLGEKAEPTGTVFFRYGSTYVTSITASLATIAVLLTGGVLAIPSITMDRTCHNMFRDGRTSVDPQVNIEVQIGLEDWPRLTQFFEDFGSTHQLSFRNESHSEPIVEVLQLSLCNEQGTNISVIDQHWASQDFAPVLRGSGVPLGVYEVRPGSDWQRLTRDLVAQLETTWPGKVQFRGKDGRVTSPPPALQ